MIIEPSRGDDPPVLTDKQGRLLPGTGQRAGALSPNGLAFLSWGFPRAYEDRRENPLSHRELMALYRSLF